MMRRLAWALLLLAGVPIHAQTIYPPINAPVFRALDANGNPLAGGRLYTYAAGSSTPQATYADAMSGTPNTNPVVLDSTGQAKIFLGAANYKFVLKDTNDVEQWTVDNINGAPSPGNVTSVFGRTGAVVAAIGDYSCAQITGAVCTGGLPTLYYQTVQQGGTSKTQRGAINLIAGSNVTINCADNSGANRTDCTVAANIPTVNVTGTLHDVTSSRVAGVSYQNTNAFAIYVSGYFITDGSSEGYVYCAVGASSASDNVSGKQYGATTNGHPAGFECVVPAGHWYQIDRGGSAIFSTGKWFETDLH